ncbi:hypothetical protein DNI29_19140 [Hymenobacter sediminis]|uniref:sialate O-acetylesterase n=1 Tax=Hymenobacter sediminis TaxID=2218621 RepID=UPI000DA6B3C8|nr:sialate O-acetylesterase [Hymenobacter sediminis]RPD45498.1 hypothetical protein DNI29_19140 [Hymenobacter sediminis]
MAATTYAQLQSQLDQLNLDFTNSLRAGANLDGPVLAALLNRQSQLMKDLALLAAAGASVLRYGSGKPANTLGKDGDVYRDTATGDEYQKASGAYVLRMNLKGEPGKTPVPGQDYQSGEDGLDGEDGNSTFAETYAPDDALGIDKDIWIYVNTTDKTASYFAKVAGKWRPVGSAVGGGTTPPTTTPANQAPTITFTAPASGATVPVGTVLTLTATATDDTAVTSVEFLNGSTGGSLGTANKNGTTYTLSYTVNTAGPMSFVAKATDGAGLSSTATVSITVQAAAPPVNQAPSVALTGNSTGTVGVSQSFQAIASDSDGTVTKVELVDANGAVLASDTTSPYVLDWTPSAVGTFKVRAKVTDDDGATAFSSEVSVVVNPAPSGGSSIPAGAAHLLIMDGQSNSSGINSITEFQQTTYPLLASDPLDEFARAYIWTDNKWQKLRWGLNNRGAGGNGFGAEIGFAQRWEAENPTGDLYIVKHGSPGNPINSWRPGNFQYTSLVQDVTAAKNNLVAAGKTPYVVGFLWNQWESDEGSASGYYQGKLTDLIQRLIADNVILATTKKGIVGRTSGMLAEQNAYIATDANSKLLNTTGFPLNSDDNLHYTGRSQYLLGGYDAFNYFYGSSAAYPFPLVPSGSNPAPKTPAITADRPVLQAGVTVDQTSPALYYWGFSGIASSAQGAIYGNDPGFFTEFKFNSTGFTLTAPTLGGFAQKYDVYVDGVKKGTMDEATNGGTITISGLTNAVHTARLVPNGGYLFVKTVAISTVAVTTPEEPAYVPGSNGKPVLISGAYASIQDNRVLYSPSQWAADSTNRARFSQTGYLEINFTGPRVALDAPDFGGYPVDMDVYIDNAFRQNITRPATTNGGMIELFAVSNLSDTTHTLKLVPKNGKYAMFGRLRVPSANSGQELLLNPSFDSPATGNEATGWKAAGDWQVLGNGTATHVALPSAVSAYLSQRITGLTVGAAYKVRTVFTQSGGSLVMDSETGAANNGAVGGGDSFYLFTATQTFETFRFKYGYGGPITLDLFSVSPV